MSNANQQIFIIEAFLFIVFIIMHDVASGLGSGLKVHSVVRNFSDSRDLNQLTGKSWMTPHFHLHFMNNNFKVLVMMACCGFNGEKTFLKIVSYVYR